MVKPDKEFFDRKRVSGWDTHYVPDGGGDFTSRCPKDEIIIRCSKECRKCGEYISDPIYENCRLKKQRADMLSGKHRR